MCKPDTPDVPDPIKPDPVVKKQTKQKRGQREGLEAQAAALYGSESNRFASNGPVSPVSTTVGAKTMFGV